MKKFGIAMFSISLALLIIGAVMIGIAFTTDPSAASIGISALH